MLSISSWHRRITGSAGCTRKEFDGTTADGSKEENLFIRQFSTLWQGVDPFFLLNIRIKVVNPKRAQTRLEIIIACSIHGITAARITIYPALNGDPKIRGNVSIFRPGSQQQRKVIA